jgi:hypothetical protein
VVQKMSCRRSKRSIKTRNFYMAGNGTNCRWVEGVEEATTTAMSIRKEGLMQRHIQCQAILQKEEDDDSDATVVMKDDAEQDTYPMSDNKCMRIVMPQR